MNAIAETSPDLATPALSASTSGGADHAAGGASDEALRCGQFLADLTVRWIPIVARAALYTILGMLAQRYEVGQHMLAGVLFGDFAGYAATSLRGFQREPVHTGSELVLFTALFAVWWAQYPWPTSREDQAVFCLAGFGALIGRLGVAGMRIVGNRDDGWS